MKLSDKNSIRIVFSSYLQASPVAIINTTSGNITAQTANVYAGYVVANTGFSGLVLTNAQPYITSLGTLSSLSVSGNLSAGTANVYAAYVVANTALVGTLATNAQTNITTWIGFLTSRHRTKNLCSICC